VHFLIQSVSKYSVTEIIRMIKSITTKKIFEKHPEVKKQLWDGEFWSDGFFVNTVSKLVCFREELIPRSSAAGSFISFAEILMISG